MYCVPSSSGPKTGPPAVGRWRTVARPTGAPESTWAGSSPSLASSSPPTRAGRRATSAAAAGDHRRPCRACRSWSRRLPGGAPVVARPTHFVSHAWRYRPPRPPARLASSRSNASGKRRMKRGRTTARDTRRRAADLYLARRPVRQPARARDGGSIAVVDVPRGDRARRPHRERARAVGRPSRQRAWVRGSSSARLNLPPLEIVSARRSPPLRRRARADDVAA